jgi:hypothetical protein
MNDFDCTFWLLLTDTFPWIIGSFVVPLMLGLSIACAKESKVRSAKSRPAKSNIKPVQNAPLNPAQNEPAPVGDSKVSH